MTSDECPGKTAPRHREDWTGRRVRILRCVVVVALGKPIRAERLIRRTDARDNVHRPLEAIKRLSRLHFSERDTPEAGIALVDHSRQRPKAGLVQANGGRMLARGSVKGIPPVNTPWKTRTVWANSTQPASLGWLPIWSFHRWSQANMPKGCGKESTGRERDEEQSGSGKVSDGIDRD